MRHQRIKVTRTETLELLLPVAEELEAEAIESMLSTEVGTNLPGLVVDHDRGAWTVETSKMEGK